MLVKNDGYIEIEHKSPPQAPLGFGFFKIYEFTKMKKKKTLKFTQNISPPPELRNWAFDTMFSVTKYFC